MVRSIDDVKLAQLCLTVLGVVIVLKNSELASVAVPMIITAIGSLAGLKKGGISK